MTTLRTSAAALTIAAATVGLSACSSDEKAPTAKDAWNKAQDTAGTYKSMELKLDGKENGKPASYTMKGDVDGDPQAVTGTIDGGKLEGIMVGPKTYIKADKAYWEKSLGASGASVADKMAGQWIESPETSSSADKDALSGLIKDLRDDSSEGNKKLLDAKATVTKDKVDGKDAWKITSADKKVIAWVSTDDSRDVLKAQGIDTKHADGGESSTVTFVSHDKDYGIKAPAGAKKVQDIVK